MVRFLQPLPWSAMEAQEIVLRVSPQLKGDELTKAANLWYRMHQIVFKYQKQACVRSEYLLAAFNPTRAMVSCRQGREDA